MPPINPRMALLALLAVLTFCLLRAQLSPRTAKTATSQPDFPDLLAQSLGTYTETSNAQRRPNTSTTSSSPTDTYFDLAFAPTTPQEEQQQQSPPYAFPALRKQCAHTTWRNSNTSTGPIYLQCEGIYLGLTSVISQVKACLKMAIEAGTGLILPAIPLRAADNLLIYNQGNADAERPFGAWFDQAHLVAALAAACPGLDVVTPRDVAADGSGRVRVVNRWSVDLHDAYRFRDRDGYFWVGKPFGLFFEERLGVLRAEHGADVEEKVDGQGGQEEEHKSEDEHKSDDGGETEESTTADGEDPHSQLARRTDTDTTGATIIGMRADVELFSATNDPTGHERLLWDDLGRTLRFLAEPRAIVDQMLRQLGGDDYQAKRPMFFAVHFRGEGDNMWAAPAEQMRVDLDALDAAWELYRHDEGVWRGDGEKPPVYLACGDEASLVAFAAEGSARGWNVTSKYALAKSMETSETLDMIEALPFDFQAIIDLGLLVKSYFFIGLMGSAFSYTAANLRDPTTRYRGSSFEVWDDGGARTHLFPNRDKYGDTTMEKYACCL